MKLLEIIKAAMARLADLTKDELTELKGNIIKCAEEFPDDSTEAASVLTELMDYAEKVQGRSDTLKAEETAAAEATRAAREKIARLSDEPGEGDEGEGTEVTEGEPVEGEEAAGEPVAGVLVASTKPTLRATPASMKRGAKSNTSPELNSGAPTRPVLVAAGQLVNHSFGDEFEDSISLAEEMASVLEGLDPLARNGRVLVARAKWGDLYDESRTLSGRSTVEDFRKMDAICGRRNGRRSALAASGGVPLPTNVDYSMDVWATADRPLRDGLAAFRVDRGGLLYRQPPTLADLSTSSTVWSNANDIDPTDPSTKPVYTVVAQETTQVFISAIPTRLQFGNLMGQFDPETIAANTDLAIANAARVAELNLLTQIQGFSVNTITSSELLGASRDLFRTLIQTASAYRHTYRLKRDQMLTAIFPVWGLDMIKQDRLMEQAHDDAGTNVFAITDDEVNEWLSAYGVKVIWTLDGLAADAGGGTYDAQYFSAFTASEGIPAYPAEVVWNLFIEGSIQFLDGGRLDLGVVRDATLDSTNDYETFVEPFENVANRSFAGGVLQIVTTTVPAGSSSETVSVS